MNILGINSFFDDPAVALICDGELVFAIEDERLTGIKHGKRYNPYRTYIPFNSIHAALQSQGLRIKDLDEVSYSYSRRYAWQSLLSCFARRRYSTMRHELAAFRSLLSIRHALSSGYDAPQRYSRSWNLSQFKAVPYREWNHHLCHAASAFFCSGFPASLVVVADGCGEDACTSVFAGQGKQLTKLAQMSMPHSLGFFYAFITSHIGFEALSDEYKVMGLAAYGQPRFQREMESLVSLEPRGRYRIDMAALLDLKKLLGPRRQLDGPLDQIHSDIARSAQDRLETVIEHVVTYHMRATGATRLCLAGGTFLNCVVNGRLSRLDMVKEIFVQPAAHDAGTAVGAAALSWVRRGGTPQLRYDSMFLGTWHDDERIEAALKQTKARYAYVDESAAVVRIAELLASGKIVGVFRNRMEFGPRALGNHSILASPCSTEMRQRLNQLKGREQFRPLAPIVTAEAFAEFFEGPPNRYMTITVNVRPEVRERVPAIVHVDGTARAQVVHAADDPFLHALLACFSQHAGVPVLINSSLNVRGKPMDQGPFDALVSLYTSGLDYLLMGSFLVEGITQQKGNVATP